MARDIETQLRALTECGVTVQPYLTSSTGYRVKRDAIDVESVAQDALFELGERASRIEALEARVAELDADADPARAEAS